MSYVYWLFPGCPALLCSDLLQHYFSAKLGQLSDALEQQRRQYVSQSSGVAMDQDNNSEGSSDEDPGGGNGRPLEWTAENPTLLSTGSPGDLPFHFRSLGGGEASTTGTDAGGGARNLLARPLRRRTASAVTGMLQPGFGEFRHLC